MLDVIDILLGRRTVTDGEAICVLFVLYHKAADYEMRTSLQMIESSLNRRGEIFTVFEYIRVQDLVRLAQVSLGVAHAWKGRSADYDLSNAM